MVKPGGTVALWVSTIDIPTTRVKYISRTPPRLLSIRNREPPDLSPLITEHSLGKDSLGPYWEPGRRILDNHYRDIPFPTSTEWDAASARRVYFSGDVIEELKGIPEHVAEDLESAPLLESDETRSEIIKGKTMPWEGVQAWLRTWSALHNYQEQFPEDKERTGKGKEGNIVDKFVEILKEKVGKDTLDIQWPVSLIMIKKEI